MNTNILGDFQISINAPLRVLLKTFPSELSNGWYVVTRGILFIVLF